MTERPSSKEIVVQVRETTKLLATLANNNERLQCTLADAIKNFERLKALHGPKAEMKWYRDAEWKSVPVVTAIDDMIAEINKVIA